MSTRIESEGGGRQWPHPDPDPDGDDPIGRWLDEGGPDRPDPEPDEPSDDREPHPVA